MRPPAARVIAAAASYFAIVYAVGFVLGPIRVLWVAPRLGATWAVLAETPLLLVAIVLAARRLPRRFGLRGRPPALAAMGLLALLLQQSADLALGLALRGGTVAHALAQFATPAGWVYAGALAAFAAMPLLLNRRRANFE